MPPELAPLDAASPRPAEAGPLAGDGEDATFTADRELERRRQRLLLLLLLHGVVDPHTPPPPPLPLLLDPLSPCLEEVAADAAAAGAPGNNLKTAFELRPGRDEGGVPCSPPPPPAPVLALPFGVPIPLPPLTPPDTDLPRTACWSLGETLSRSSAAAAARAATPGRRRRRDAPSRLARA